MLYPRVGVYKYYLFLVFTLVTPPEPHSGLRWEWRVGATYRGVTILPYGARRTPSPTCLYVCCHLQLPRLLCPSPVLTDGLSTISPGLVIFDSHTSYRCIPLTLFQPATPPLPCLSYVILPLPYSTPYFPLTIFQPHPVPPD